MTITRSEIFSSISDIDFTAKDPDTITEEVISKYELCTGRSLKRSDPIRLFLNAIILEFILQRNELDHAAKMNLIAFATGSYLDHIGALYGVSRLGATTSTCTLQFTLSATFSVDSIIPAGTRATPDGKIYFATTETLTIPTGQVSGTVLAVCSESGTVGNEYIPGQVNKIVDPIPYEMRVQNIDTSSGGVDVETDEAFRERIHIAPESFSVAGPKRAYKYFALSVDSNIEDVCVLSTSDRSDIPAGNVYIYVLLKNGILPDNDMLNKVLQACNADDVRPDTDFVHVFAPAQVNYQVNVEYWIDAQNSSQIETIQPQVEAAIYDWTKWQGNALGRDINPTKLIHDIVAAGAKRCNVITPTYQELQTHQVAHVLSPLKITFKGLD